MDLLLLCEPFSLEELRKLHAKFTLLMAVAALRPQLSGVKTLSI